MTMVTVTCGKFKHDIAFNICRKEPNKSYITVCALPHKACVNQTIDLTLVPLENQQQQCNGQVSTQQHDQNSNIIADIFRFKTKGPQNGIPIHFHRGQLSPRYSLLGIWCEEEACRPMILIIHQSFESVPTKHWGYCHISVHAALQQHALALAKVPAIACNAYACNSAEQQRANNMLCIL